jgi:hypothetical protein
MPQGLVQRPNVWLVGDVEHVDFAEAVELIRATASLGPGLPEVVVVAQSRPGAVGRQEWMRLRRIAPLAGFVSLLGSWCEGETRTGRPAAGVERLYWYEFPIWWRRQLALRAAGCCPEWARRDEDRMLRTGHVLLNQRVAIAAERWDTAAAIGDAVGEAGAKAVWVSGECAPPDGVTAGIWDGGQLGDSELTRLTAFCSQLAGRNAPAIALLDFPRRDRCEAAQRAGAAVVLGKPWPNADLVTTLRQAISPAINTVEAA